RLVQPADRGGAKGVEAQAFDVVDVAVFLAHGSIAVEEHGAVARFRSVVAGHRFGASSKAATLAEFRRGSQARRADAIPGRGRKESRFFVTTVTRGPCGGNYPGCVPGDVAGRGRGSRPGCPGGCVGLAGPQSRPATILDAAARPPFSPRQFSRIYTVGASSCEAAAAKTSSTAIRVMQRKSIGQRRKKQGLHPTGCLTIRASGPSGPVATSLEEPKMAT